MRNRNIKYIALAAVALLLGWFVKEAFTQPGVQDLPGNFTEVALYRNENNTGPIVRIYAVTVADTSRWAEMEQYGNYMPHTKYGDTKVYFFAQGRPVPTQVGPGAENFGPEFRPYCLAVYEKDAMSQSSLRRYPFR